MPTYTASFSHVDTCLPDYVLDHCNGDDECLLGVYVDGNTTYEQLKAGLREELDSSDWGIPDEAWDAVDVALEDLFRPVDSMSTAFDNRLETRSDDDCGLPSCYAWFRLSWEQNDDDDDDDDGGEA
jgi:hypothetical protein